MLELLCIFEFVLIDEVIFIYTYLDLIECYIYIYIYIYIYDLQELLTCWISLRFK